MRVFDIQEDFAIVRLVNLSMAVVDDSGKMKHSLAGYKSVRIQENHIIAVTDKRNNEMYIDLYSGHLYTRKPKVVRLGDVQLLEVDGISYSGVVCGGWRPGVDGKGVYCITATSEEGNALWCVAR